MRALIFSEGNGYGHASRDRILAEYFNIPLMTFGKGAEYCRINNMKFTEIPSPYKIHTGPERVRIAANIVEIVKMLKPEVFNTIKDSFSQVDFVIVDGSSLGMAVAMLMGKKFVFITNDTTAIVGINGILEKKIASSFFHQMLKAPKHVIVPDFPPPLTVSSLNLESAPSLPLIYAGPLVTQVPQKRHNKKYVVMGMLEKELEGILGNDAIYGSGSSDIKGYYRDGKAVICHGGHTTIMEALSFGKPILCILDSAYSERCNNAKMLLQKDIGVALNRKQLTRESVLAALEYLETMNRLRLDIYARTYLELKPLKTIESLLKKMDENVQ